MPLAPLNSLRSKARQRFETRSAFCSVLQAQRDGIERDVGHRSAALESMTKRANEQAAQLSTAEARVACLEQGAAASDKELVRLRSDLDASAHANADLQQQLEGLQRALLTEQGQSKVLPPPAWAVDTACPITDQIFDLVRTFCKDALSSMVVH